MDKVATTHPAYDKVSGRWQVMRDTIEGEDEVKNAGQRYLPMKSGQRAKEEADGKAEYEAYLCRANFPDIIAPAVRAMTGLIHRKPAEIELPSVLEPLRESATVDGLSLDLLHRNITYELLSVGRYVLAGDVSEEQAKPVIATYPAESLINWDVVKIEDKRVLSFAVFNEATQEREGFTWKDVERWRVFDIDPGDEETDSGLIVTLYEKEGGQVKEAGVFMPRYSNGQRLDFLPITVIGSNDLTPDPDEVPLIGLARVALAMYRNSADYENQLFMSGEETLFCFGVSAEDAPSIIGSGVVNSIPSSEASAAFVGPSGAGLDAQRTAIQDKRDQADTLAVQKITSTGSSESGKALEIRQGAKTATLTSIAQSSAAGLEDVLRKLARLYGADENQVVVEPNLDFVDDTFTPQELDAVLSGWERRAYPKSVVNSWLRQKELTDMTDEELEQALASEDTMGMFAMPEEMPVEQPSPE